MIAFSAKKDQVPMNATQQFETVIGPSVKVEGDLHTADNIRIDGTVAGNVKTAANLEVGTTATIDASIEAHSAIVAGKVNGNVTVSDRLELLASAQVTGDLEASVVQIAPGALFNGKCTMKGMPAVSENIDSEA